MELKTLQTITANFLKELEDANAGKKTSLPFIIHELPSVSLVKDGETFQVLVIGGSIFLNALLKKENGRLKILKRESKSKPPYHTKDDFLRVMEEEIDTSIDNVAINFAFPLLPVFEKGRLDGKLLRGTKEHTFVGLVGEKIGESVEKYILQKKQKSVTVSIANDTICLLLSGLTQVTTSDIAAGIVGTGDNFAIFLDKHRVVNLESASFDKVPQSEEGELLDKTSQFPGTQLFEKETSGAYLYQLYNIHVEKEGLGLPVISSTLELDSILRDKNAKGRLLAKAIFARSAELIACQIAAITKFKQTDMTFVMEGSVFWRATGYRSFVKKKLLEIAPEYAVTFVKIEDSPIFGAAKLVA
ncbi:MAG TPA: hypothetical protein VLF68_03130 [Candidatus Saccharimonadales bacterium]|nr:hypothetical protein [Candidatus Saccharimonadales bacterium]